MNQASLAYRRLATLSLTLTAILVALGGFVHNSGSSLACPDWPLCFGQVFPKMEGAVAVEHSHRLLASFIGLVVIGLCFVGARERQRDPSLFRGSLFALLLVSFQGVLGGVTVLMQLSPFVSTAHLATSQIFLALLIWLNMRARGIRPTEAPPAKAIKGLRWAAGLLFLQMLLGASIRHGGAGVACGLGADSMILCTDALTASRTLWPSFAQAQLHMLHRFGAIVAGVAVIAGTMPILKWAKARGIKALRLLCVAGHILWTAQVIVGVLTIRNYIGIATTTIHLVLAMALWSVVASLNLYAMEKPRT